MITTRMLEDYQDTERRLRTRVKDLRAHLRGVPPPERDDIQRRLAVLYEELRDVESVRMELARRKKGGMYQC